MLLTGTLGSAVTTFTYSGFGELATEESRHGAAVLYSGIYTRDNGGRLSERTETIVGTITTDAYGYDLAARLTTMTRGGAIALYTYDANWPCVAWEGVDNYKGSFGISGYVKAGLDPTEQLVGSYRIDILYDPDTRTATYTLTNTTSVRSLVYGVAPDWKRSSFKPGGNMTQVYTWTERAP